MEFVELAARTSFSFLRGAAHPEEMVERAHALGLAGLAVCDRDGLYGLARAHVKAGELSLPLHAGAELPVALTEAELEASLGLDEQQRRSVSRTARPNALRKRMLAEDAFPSLLFLVESHLGYQNLCWLLTRAHAELDKGECLLDLDDLAGRTSGLLVLVPAHTSIAADRTDAHPERVLGQLRDLFGANVYSLSHRRLTRDDAAREAVVLERQARYGMLPVASACPTYHDKSRKRLADVLQCIRLGTTLSEARTRIAANGQAYLRSGRQMQRLFADHRDWVARSVEVASKLSFSLDELHYHFPCQPPAGLSADEYLQRLSWEGAARRYPDGVPPKVRVQVETELALIRNMEMAAYFLSTWEVVEIARERGILCQGRGSAANSAVCYVLGITAVNPEHSNLLFERFMSNERKEPPDIDVDFEHERREEVIQEIYRRYGRERAAMVSEVICYRRRSALRDVSKAFGLSLEQTNRLVNAFSYWDPAIEKDASLGQRLEQAGLDDSALSVRGVLEMASALVGFPRHLSIHVGGFVLSSRPLFEVSPVEPARMEDRTVVPWDKDDLDILGFFKIDVLALGMLTAVRKAIELVWCSGLLRRPAPELDGVVARAPESFDPIEVITRLPDEDPAVYAMTCQADTVGVFQIESRAQMAMLPRLRPRCFYDLVIEVAIVRPGPIQGGMVHPYLRRRNGEEAPTCHPSLTAILERTLGVPLFQEQVMQIAIVGAGYSGGEADQLRRDMAAWKRTGRLLSHRERLLTGFAKNGIARRFGEALFEQIKGFGEYGFPESHAASFALLVYKSAWLKAHYPAHFLCALLNSQPMGFYSPASLVKDAQKHGVIVLPVCVLASDWDCTLEVMSPSASERSVTDSVTDSVTNSAGACSDSGTEPAAQAAIHAVRLGLRMVKGLGTHGAEQLVQSRRALGASGRRFVDFADLVRRVPLSKLDIEVLAEAGAFAALEPERRQVLWSARAPEQLGLFREVSAPEPRVQLPPLSPIEVLALDYARVRLSIDDHPLRHLRVDLQRWRVLTAAELAASPAGRRVRVAGLVTARQRPGTASGVVFVTMEDETGIANLIFYSSVFEAYRSVAQHAPLLLVTGKVERHDPHPGSVDTSNPREARGVAPIVHLLVESAERLKLPGPKLAHSSRDFH